MGRDETTQLSVGFQSLDSRESQIKKEHLIEVEPNDLIVERHCLLVNPSYFKHLRTDSEQNPRAPTSMAKKFTDQPLIFIAAHSAEYLLCFFSCQADMFSSHGHVSSMIMTFLVYFEISRMSGLNWVTAR